ncbi:MAG: hypothetical protein Q9218_003866 [Villophora microphyllina]
MHIAPWNLETSEPDPEIAKEEPAASIQTPGVHETVPIESSPLRPNTESTYDSISDEEKETSAVTHSPASPPPSTEWPPPDAPRWIFGFKFSQKFLSPSERPPIFSKWYHVFKLLWPVLIMDQLLTLRPNPNIRDPHPQATLSGILCIGTMVVKLALGLMFALAPLSGSKKLSSPDMTWLGIAEAWGAILIIFYHDGLYWKSRGWGALSGRMAARLRLSFFVTMSVGLWVGVWIARAWDWRDFGLFGLPFAVLVGMSYGLALERWV